MTIAVLAVQGAFAEHRHMLEKMGVSTIELRQKSDLENTYDGLILPGGESTVQGKLIKDFTMFSILKEQIANGLPVLATCAGLILLAEHLENDNRVHFQTLPVCVKRNAYGRQLGSFYTEESFLGIGTVPMTFIRAPYIESVQDDVTVLATHENHIVAVRYKNQLALSFHPELNQDTRIHASFLSMCH